MIDKSSITSVITAINYLHPLKLWDRGFESHLRHECLCAFILCLLLSCVQVAVLRRADPRSKESYRLCKKIKKLKKRPRTKKGL
jgi:hypothetical protein